MRCSRRSRGAGRRSERLEARGRERRSLFGDERRGKSERRRRRRDATTGPRRRRVRARGRPNRLCRRRHHRRPRRAGTRRRRRRNLRRAAYRTRLRRRRGARSRGTDGGETFARIVSKRVPYRHRGRRRAANGARGRWISTMTYAESSFAEDRAAAAFLFDESSHDCAWRGFRSRRRLAGASALVPAQSLARVGSGEEDARSFGRASRGASRAVRRAQARRRGSWFRASRLRAASARSPVRGPSLDDASSARAATARAPNRGHGPVPGACAGRGRASRRGARG